MMKYIYYWYSQVKMLTFHAVLSLCNTPYPMTHILSESEAAITRGI